ncbi:MAG: hypothetical protein EUB_00086 [Eubacterium sp.]|uniref:hypothetical protein n=1 Tax=Eubacterium sp. TaxID=142586 RepID=UPI00305E2BA8
MNPTLKTTLAKTLIILSLALAAFFAYPSRGVVASGATGDFTVTGTGSYTYDESAKTLTVNSGANVTIKNMVPGTPTADKIVVAGDANITLDGVNIKVNKQNAIDLQSGTANIILKGDNTLVTTEENGGYSKAALRVAEQAALVLNEGDTKGSLDVKVDSSGWSGAAIGSDCGDGGNSVTIKTAGAITINGGTIVATTAGKQKGAAIGGGVYGNASKITINGGHVKATVLGNSGESQHAGAGIGSGALGNNAGDTTITGGHMSFQPAPAPVSVLASAPAGTLPSLVAS